MKMNKRTLEKLRAMIGALSALAPRVAAALAGGVTGLSPTESAEDAG